MVLPYIDMNPPWVYMRSQTEKIKKCIHFDEVEIASRSKMRMSRETIILWMSEIAALKTERSTRHIDFTISCSGCW